MKLRRANRHGLIAGATGTGKTITLQVLAEGFSDAGVPVFLADVKGDLTGMAQAAEPDARLLERAGRIGFDDYRPRGYPTVFWDVFGEKGHPLRATVAEMGPLLLARMLELNEVQEGVLNVVFRVADEEGLALLDLKDLQAMLAETAKRTSEISARYGNVAPASVGAIQRRLLVLENQGADRFFGEPALQLSDLIGCDHAGRGRISILAADRLMRAPRLYASMLLWLLSQLFEELPEVGDPEKPILAFFFDEAHLLFDGAPRALVEKVELVARLIRSKGVGVYFVTQSPSDVPETILGQLGNRIQHALRAYTPRDQRALRAAADGFRSNPAFDTARAISELGVGEAVVSMLDDRGAPGVVQRTLIRPPQSRMGPADPDALAAARAASPLLGLYERAVDSESAHEILAAKAAAAAIGAAADDPDHARGRRYSPTVQPAPRLPARGRETAAEAAMKSFARSVASQAGRSLMRGLLGGLFKGR
ncbi:MAG: helicase HerA-like domain-containing protein [Rubrimonas sp.]